MRDTESEGLGGWSTSFQGQPDVRARVVIYSHDTFGLGHLRRSRAIANALAAGRPGVSVLIISGSPVVGSFDFGSGVDFVRIPGVTKLPGGDYRSLNLNISLDETVRLREDMILATVDSFQPDCFIVDKEPTGFRGEVLPALQLLKGRGARTVLGLRDVMDDPHLLAAEWERKDAVDALRRLYDEIWVYGLQAIYRPLAGLGLPREIEDRLLYTGYIEREAPHSASMPRYPAMTEQPFILVTTGGGGDGDDVIDWVISAYENEAGIALPALINFGPFLSGERRRGFLDRIARHPALDAIAFDAKIEHLMRKAAAVVAMGGYNTFCEILSFDKRSLIVPRTRPRLEQHIRAVQAERLGLARMLSEENGARDPARMAEALRRLPDQPKPSEVTIPGLLGGLAVIQARFDATVGREPPVPVERPAAA